MFARAHRGQQVDHEREHIEREDERNHCFQLVNLSIFPESHSQVTHPIPELPLRSGNDHPCCRGHQKQWPAQFQ